MHIKKAEWVTALLVIPGAYNEYETQEVALLVIHEYQH